MQRKNGIDQFGDADDVGVQVKGETSEVDGRELGTVSGQFGPGGVCSQIDGPPFLIAVAKTAETAEQIAQVDEEDQRAARWDMLDVVMPLDDFADKFRELPSLTEDYAAVTVREAEGFPFLLGEGAAALNRVGLTPSISCSA